MIAHEESPKVPRRGNAPPASPFTSTHARPETCKSKIEIGSLSKPLAGRLRYGESKSARKGFCQRLHPHRSPIFDENRRGTFMEVAHGHRARVRRSPEPAAPLPRADSSVQALAQDKCRIQPPRPSPANQIH